MKLYVTEMLRWGDRETHSYVAGVYTTLEQAELAGNAVNSWRAGKYEYAITEIELDYINPEILEYHKQCIEPVVKDIDTILSHEWIE